jgi:5-formyltetrahydrofolate cyclo-ligase
MRQIRQEFVKERNSNDFMTSDVALMRFTKLISSVKSVSGYAAIGSEADITSLIAVAVLQGLQTSLPWIASRAEQPTSRMMCFKRWTPGDPLIKSDYGFLQPLASQPEIAPAFILIPLVAFDRCCNRLGQGAGDYDRALANLPNAIKLGIAWSVQEVDAIPVDSWDVPLDAILTEREWISRGLI